MNLDATATILNAVRRTARPKTGPAKPAPTTEVAASRSPTKT